MNVYRIEYGYLGIAPISYWVLNIWENKWEKMHTYRPSTVISVSETSFQNPSLKVGWVNYNGNNNASMSLYAGSAQSGSIGDFGLLNFPSFAHANTLTSIAAATETTAFFIRNRRTFNTNVN